MLPQYKSLERWATEHHLEFEVTWYDDHHILSATHHKDSGMVAWSYVKFPHKGGMHDLRPWGHDEVTRKFLRMFARKARPIQPTPPLGYVID